MDIPLSAAGDPELPFLVACSKRSIAFSGEADAPHPLQLIPAKWRALAEPLQVFVDELVAVGAAYDPDGKPLVEAFRRLIYEATELFDCYANMLPKRIRTQSKSERQTLTEFKDTAQRLRGFAGQLCNRCKHESAQLQFLWGRSESNGRTSARLLVQVYKAGNALLRDDQIHKGRMAGLGIVRLGHELAHNLLRIDRAVAKLVLKIGVQDGPERASVSPAVPVGAPLRQLAALEATRHSDEEPLHYGLVFRDRTVELTRVRAADLGPNVHMRLTMTHHLPTTSYSVA